MRVSEVHVRKSEFFTPRIDPYYANNKYNLYYPKACPQGAEETSHKQCLMTPELLSILTNLDVSQLAGNVDTNKSRTLRYIKSLDEKLNSPQYEFLKEFQPDVSCACEETITADAQCPCPPVKGQMNFSLFEKKHCKESDGAGQGFSQPCYQDSGKVDCRKGARKDAEAERDELLRQTDALQKKLGSPEFEFLYLVPVDLARCACSPDDFPRAECSCPVPVKPTDFRDKLVHADKPESQPNCFVFGKSGLKVMLATASTRHDIKKKILAMDGLLKSPEFGLSSSCRSSNTRRFAARPTGGVQQRCVPGCPPSPCRCGKDCPSMRGSFEKYPEQTFHVPDCPEDTFRMPLPRSPVQGTKACPFSPACCPIADTCPFPVNTVYDPSAPPLPPLTGPRVCPRVPTDPMSVNDSNRPDCPLNPLKLTAGSPPGCPLTKPTSCQIGQSSGCPLLTCSLGPLKTFIFDGHDECPFCQSKCCPMISPDGPGCPLKISGNFCPLGNSDVCALKGVSSRPEVLPAAQPEKDQESCPVGEVLAQSENQQRVVNGPQPTSGCYCAAASSSYYPAKRPKDCPLAGIDTRPPAPPCPFTTASPQRPTTKTGSSNVGERSNVFDCPGLTRSALTKLLTEPSISHEKNSDHLKKALSKEKSDSNTNNAHQMEPKLNKKGRNSIRRGSTKAKAKKEISYNPALKQTPSAVTGKTDDVMRKTESTVYDTEPTQHTTATLKTNSSSSNSYFEVSLEPLPRPPLSEYENTRNSFSSRKSYSQRTKRRSWPSDREETTHVKASLPDDSIVFQREGPKPKPKNCPFPEPEKCPLEIPKCPFGSPEPSCPLAKTTNCGARSICSAGMALGAARNDCPIETPSCNLFPEGHCPMENMNVCGCDYPVSPCMEPLIPVEDACAPDQYCAKLNCCMGLPLPPTKPGKEFDTDTWYKFAEVLPGDKHTKRYLEILNYPPEPDFFVSVNEQRKHPAWKIIKQGEGYKHCKQVKDLLAERGPSADVATQFQQEDLPDDEEIRIIEQNRINSQKAIQNLLTSGRCKWNEDF